jgi:hypothetical protein
MATGWTPDYCLDALTPRAAGFLLESQSRREARQLLQLVSIVHGDPKEVHGRLADVAFPRPAAGPMTFTDSLAAMAGALGQHDVARKIKTRDLAIRALRKIRDGARA